MFPVFCNKGKIFEIFSHYTRKGLFSSAHFWDMKKFCFLQVERGMSRAAEVERINFPLFPQKLQNFLLSASGFRLFHECGNWNKKKASKINYGQGWLEAENHLALQISYSEKKKENCRINSKNHSHDITWNYRIKI